MPGKRRGFRNGPAAGAPQRHSWTSRRNLRVLANPPPVTIAAETPSSYIPRTRSNQISTLKLSQSSEAPCRAVCWYRWSLSPLSQLHSVSGHLVPVTLCRPAACLSTTPYLTIYPNNSTKRRETQLLEPALTSSCVPAAYNRSTVPTILPNPSHPPPPFALQPAQPKQSRLTATTLQRISLDSPTGAI